MYKFRYSPAPNEAECTWTGEFPTAEEALAAGWNMYGEAIAIEVAECQPIMFSTTMPSPGILFSGMQDAAHALLPSGGSSEDAAVDDAFDSVPFHRKAQLHALLVEITEEWESELPEHEQFQAVKVLSIRRCAPGDLLP